jgi:hypothetical protein
MTRSAGCPWRIGTVSRFNALSHCYTEAKQQFANHAFAMAPARSFWPLTSSAIESRLKERTSLTGNTGGRNSIRLLRLFPCNERGRFGNLSNLSWRAASTRGSEIRGTEEAVWDEGLSAFEPAPSGFNRAYRRTRTVLAVLRHSFGVRASLVPVYFGIPEQGG